MQRKLKDGYERFKLFVTGETPGLFADRLLCIGCTDGARWWPEHMAPDECFDECQCGLGKRRAVMQHNGGLACSICGKVCCVVRGEPVLYPNSVEAIIPRQDTMEALNNGQTMPPAAPASIACSHQKFNIVWPRGLPSFGVMTEEPRWTHLDLVPGDFEVVCAKCGKKARLVFDK